MKIFSFLSLAFILTTATTSHTCGISYTASPLNPYSVAISPDGSYLATVSYTSSNVVKIFNLSKGVISGGTSYPLPSNSISPISVAFSPDGSLLAVVAHQQGTWYGNITLYNVSSGKLSNGISYDLPPGSNYPMCVAFSPNGSFLASANTYPNPNNNGSLINDVTLFKVSGGTLTNGISYPSPSTQGPGYWAFPESIAFSPDGSLLASATTITNAVDNSTTGNVAVFNVTAQGVLDAGTLYAFPQGSSGASSLAFSPKGTFLATAHPQSNSVTLYAVAQGILKTGTFYALPSNSKAPNAVAFSPNGTFLATANSGSSDITVFNVTNILSNATSYALPNQDQSPTPNSIAFSPDGSFLATGNWYYSITVFNTATWCSNTATITRANTGSVTTTSDASSTKISRFAPMLSLLGLYALQE
jgi:WD40 repeat protein